MPSHAYFLMTSFFHIRGCVCIWVLLDFSLLISRYNVLCILFVYLGFYWIFSAYYLSLFFRYNEWLSGFSPFYSGVTPGRVQGTVCGAGD